jgi:branched-chain amino acid transport system ATP-binding protein
VLKCISGLLKPKAGAVTFAGKDVTATSPRAKLGLGLVHVPQDRSLFPHMTVWDNLLMGGYSVRDHHAVKGRIEEAMAMFPILARRRHAHAGSLSGGEQKQVEIARTLLLNPRLIMLDEPSIGLDPKSRKLVFEAIGTLAASGRTVLLVEQNARSGLAASHVGAVLEAGVVRLVRAADELLTDPDVARLYLGGTPQSPGKARIRESAPSGLPEPADGIRASPSSSGAVATVRPNDITLSGPSGHDDDRVRVHGDAHRGCPLMAEDHYRARRLSQDVGVPAAYALRGLVRNVPASPKEIRHDCRRANETSPARAPRRPYAHHPRRRRPRWRGPGGDDATRAKLPGTRPHDRRPRRSRGQ